MERSTLSIAQKDCKKNDETKKASVGSYWTKYKWSLDKGYPRLISVTMSGWNMQDVRCRVDEIGSKQKWMEKYRENLCPAVDADRLLMMMIMIHYY